MTVVTVPVSTAPPPVPAWRAAVKGISLGVTLAIAVGWFFWLRPPFLGGATSYVLVSGISMEPGMHTGDLVLARRSPPYERGDVVAYRIPEGDPAAGEMVIHRVVGGDGRSGYVTRGDNTNSDDLWRPTDADVLGEAALHVPDAGHVLATARSPLGLALIAGVTTVLLLAGPRNRRTERE